MRDVGDDGDATREIPPDSATGGTALPGGIDTVAAVQTGAQSTILQTACDATVEIDSDAAREEGAGHAAVPAQWRVGDVILDLYEVVSKLGEGASAHVYRVYHRQWDMDLAVKSPRAAMLVSAGGIENFIREAETWVQLGLHPHIVSCYYVRRLGGIPRLFSEFVSEGTLDDWIRSRRLYREGSPGDALERIIDIAVQTARGLSYAHSRGLIHQDIKSSNIMLTPEGEAKVTDFGLAKAFLTAETLPDTDGSNRVTCGGMTPAYGSPEQAEIVRKAMQGIAPEKRGKLTLHTDIWSFAVVVLEMFSGGILWRFGEKADSALKDHLSADSRQGMPRMPASLADLLCRCLSRPPHDRPESMNRVADELADIYRRVCGRTYKRAVPKTDDVQGDSLNNRAVSLMDIGRAAEAEALWKRALTLHPYHPESTYNCGLHLWRSGRLTDIDLAREMQEMRRGAQEWQNNYLTGLFLLERGDYEAALRLLAPVAEAAGTRVDIGRPLGTALERMAYSRQLLKSMMGHASAVHAVSLSPDGCHGLSGGGEVFGFGRGQDFGLRLWCVATGRCLKTLQGHRGRIAAVCFCPEGSRGLSASVDSTVRLWDLDTGNCLQRFSGHSAMVSCIAFDIDRCLIISGSRDGTLKFWDADTGECVQTLDAHCGGVLSVCRHPDGQHVISGGDDGRLKIWDMQNTACVKTLDAHAGGVSAVSVDAAGSLGLSAGRDGSLKLWNLTAGRCIRVMRGHHEAVHDARISPDGHYAVSGGGDVLGREHVLRLWETASGRCLYTFEGHTDVVTSVCFSDDGRLVLSGSRDRTLKLWRSAGSAPPVFHAPMALARIQVTEITLSIQQAYRHALDAAWKMIQKGDYPGAYSHLQSARAQPGYSRNQEALECQNLISRYLPRQTFQAGWEQRAFRGHTDAVRCVACVPGDRVITGSDDASVRLWNVHDGICIDTIEIHSGSVLALAVDYRGSCFYSAGADAEIVRYGLSARNPVLRYAGHRESVFGLSLSGNGRYLLSAGEDMTLRLWDTQSGRCVRQMRGHASRVHTVCLSEDSRFAVSGSSDHSIRLWDITGERCVSIFEERTSAVLCAALDERRRRVVSGNSAGMVQVWDLDTGRCLQRFEGHDGGVLSVCTGLDGRFIVSGGEDKSIRLWDADAGICLRTFEGHAYGVDQVCFARDMGAILSAGRDGVCKLWTLDWLLETEMSDIRDDRAAPFLRTCLARWHSPDIAGLRACTADRGFPDVGEIDRLMDELACAGLGRIGRREVEQRIRMMSDQWQGSPLPAQFRSPKVSVRPGPPHADDRTPPKRSTLMLDLD